MCKALAMYSWVLPWLSKRRVILAAAALICFSTLLELFILVTFLVGGVFPLSMYLL